MTRRLLRRQASCSPLRHRAATYRRVVTRHTSTPGSETAGALDARRASLKHVPAKAVRRIGRIRELVSDHSQCSDVTFDAHQPHDQQCRCLATALCRIVRVCAEATARRVSD